MLQIKPTHHYHIVSFRGPWKPVLLYPQLKVHVTLMQHIYHCDSSQHRLQRSKLHNQTNYFQQNIFHRMCSVICTVFVIPISPRIYFNISVLVIQYFCFSNPQWCCWAWGINPCPHHSPLSSLESSSMTVIIICPSQANGDDDHLHRQHHHKKETNLSLSSWSSPSFRKQTHILSLTTHG